MKNRLKIDALGRLLSCELRNRSTSSCRRPSGSAAIPRVQTCAWLVRANAYTHSADGRIGARGHSIELANQGAQRIHSTHATAPFRTVGQFAFSMELQLACSIFQHHLDTAMEASTSRAHLTEPTRVLRPPAGCLSHRSSPGGIARRRPAGTGCRTWGRSSSRSAVGRCDDHRQLGVSL